MENAIDFSNIYGKFNFVLFAMELACCIHIQPTPTAMKSNLVRIKNLLRNIEINLFDEFFILYSQYELKSLV